MKVALLSDIHGNADALRAILKEMPDDITEYWILGDLIGYYYRADEVLEILSSLRCRYIAGNHEHYLRSAQLNSSILNEYKSKYGSSLEVALKTLSEKQLSFLSNLPDSLEFEVNSKKFLLCHGSPWDNDEYIYPDTASDKIAKFSELQADFIFLGHTHYPMEIIQDKKRIINPGSVGQPRNRKPGAHWVIFDLVSANVTFKITPYSIDSLLKDIDHYDPQNSYLKTVLTRI